jgi:aminoglycoside phosphotransferase (APT) family kinase protein
VPEREQALKQWGGVETLLHGDLWAINVFLVPGEEEPRARLIDWDHAAVGPFSYDLSTFLLRFPIARRPSILEHYREAVARMGGWQLPGPAELNFLFETAEYARFANRVIWPAIALLMDKADWGFEVLSEIDQWFEQFEPVLPGAAAAALPLAPIANSTPPAVAPGAERRE